jgi:hypothetical protein
MGILEHPFISKGYVPTTLPASALTTAPDFTLPSYQDIKKKYVQDKLPSSSGPGSLPQPAVVQDENNLQAYNRRSTTPSHSQQQQQSQPHLQSQQPSAMPVVPILAPVAIPAAVVQPVPLQAKIHPENTNTHSGVLTSRVSSSSNLNNNTQTSITAAMAAVAISAASSSAKSTSNYSASSSNQQQSVKTSVLPSASSPCQQSEPVSPPSSHHQHAQVPQINTLEKIINTLSNPQAQSGALSSYGSLSQQKVNNLWVVKYVDYTSKYGLGFLFNNGSAGVYFNDSTKIVLSATTSAFQYIERKPSSSYEMAPTMQAYTLDQYPQELHKKVTLLKHFRNYLLEQKQSTAETAAAGTVAGDGLLLHDQFASGNPSSCNNMNLEEITINGGELPYVKKWVRTKHAILFRLSNRTVQVVFYDHR